MSGLRERPRAAGALLAAIAALIAAGMLAGGALAGTDSTPSAGAWAQLIHAQRAAAVSVRQLAAARTALHAQNATLREATAAAATWRTRALRAEHRLRAERRAYRRANHRRARARG